MERCQRCFNDTGGVSIMSMFNEQMICMDCLEREKKNPRYNEAREAEAAACRRGDYNFPGIGL